MRVATLPAMQNGDDIGSPAALPESRERKIVLLLCVLAAVHVFVFTAAFPFFNNVDEPAHLDLVLQYSHGQIPREMENTSREASVYLALYCSSAYFGPTTGPIPPPPWTEPVDAMRRDLIFNSAGWQTQKNYEDSEPPFYYAVAGSWWHIGKWLGFGGGHLLYWLRFLNVALVAAMIWLGYSTARMVFPQNLFVRLGVPAILAFMPQTAFYSIENDVLSVICFAVTFICILRWGENVSAPAGAATGLAFAATCLTKMTNLPLLAVAAIFLMVKTSQFARRGKLKAALPALAAFFCCAALPIAGWMSWCKLNYGDFTGSKMKMEHFHWTIKPFSEWWHHPIFTAGGFWTYLSGQISTFWQGEFKWFYPPTALPLALPGSAVIYTLLTLALVAMALPGLFPRSNLSLFQRQALGLSLACFAVMLGFFALMSIIYDFSYSPNPSRDHPYFQAGRMLLGTLIPFLLLFVYGLDRLLNRFANRTKFIVLAISISGMLVAEIATDWPAFFNAYNWFHLP
jgi:hypothetical protein